MKRTIIIFITFLTIIGNVKGQPETIWQLLQDGSIIRWAYSGGDEFNGNELDNSKWLNSYPYGRNYVGPIISQEYNTDGNNFEFGFNPQINSGSIKLVAKREDITALGIGYEAANYKLLDGSDNLQTWHYTSGMLYSKQAFKYGLFEIHFKLPSGQGMFPAFWLYGGNPDEEFDMFEYKGETPNKIHINVHHDGIMEPNIWVTANGNFSDGFNNIMGEWGPGLFVWYLNGHEFYYLLHDLYNQANIIMNLAVGGTNCPFPPGADNNTPMPSYFEIDFIRVWTRLDCDQTITISNYNQSLTDPTVITGGNINLNNLTLNQGQYLNTIATNQIVIGPESHVSGNFHAKIVDCPGPQKNMIYSENMDDTLQIISPFVLDSINKIKSYQKSASIENPSLLYTKIYPNPSQGLITIEFIGKIDRKIKIELLNALGQVVFLKDNIFENKIEIDISKCLTGTYFLRGTFGNNSVSEKIILK